MEDARTQNGFIYRYGFSIKLESNQRFSFFFSFHKTRELKNTTTNEKLGDASTLDTISATIRKSQFSVRRERETIKWKVRYTRCWCRVRCSAFHFTGERKNWGNKRCTVYTSCSTHRKKLYSRMNVVVVVYRIMEDGQSKKEKEM